MVQTLGMERSMTDRKVLTQRQGLVAVVTDCAIFFFRKLEQQGHGGAGHRSCNSCLGDSGRDKKRPSAVREGPHDAGGLGKPAVSWGAAWSLAWASCEGLIGPGRRACDRLIAFAWLGKARELASCLEGGGRRAGRAGLGAGVWRGPAHRRRALWPGPGAAARSRSETAAATTPVSRALWQDPQRDRTWRKRAHRLAGFTSLAPIRPTHFCGLRWTGGQGKKSSQRVTSSKPTHDKGRILEVRAGER